MDVPNVGTLRLIICYIQAFFQLAFVPWFVPSAKPYLTSGLLPVFLSFIEAGFCVAPL